MPAEQYVVSIQVEPQLEVNDDREQRWNAWQQRGFERDERNRLYLLAVFSVAALALASWLSLGGAA